MKNKIVMKALFDKKILLALFLLIVISYSSLITIFSKQIGLTFDIQLFENTAEFTKSIINLVILFISVVVFYFIKNYIKSLYLRNILKFTREKVFDSQIQNNLSTLSTIDPSVYFTQMIDEVNLIEQQFYAPVLTLIEEVIGLVIVGYAIVNTNVFITIFILITSFIPLMLPNLFTKKIQAKAVDFQNETKKHNLLLNDIMEGYETYKNYNLSDIPIHKYKELNEKYSKSEYKLFSFIDFVSALANNSALIVVMGTLILGMFLSINNLLSIGEVFALSFLSGNMIGPLSAIISNIPKLKSAKNITEKFILKESMNIKKENLKEINISIDNLSLKLNDKEILKNISLKLDSGKKYALVGGSGSGKSTIIKCILGFFDKNSYTGDISINNLNYNDFDINILYQNISYMSQSNTFFSGTIKENISFFEDVDNEIVFNSMKNANIYNKISSFEEKENHIIDSDAKTFSGGEAQRLAIARTLARNNIFYILDEATSALDKQNYKEIETWFLKQDISLISVTHRLSKDVLAKYDEIIVLNDGEIVEKGSFDSLINLKAEFFNLHTLSNNI